VCSAQRIVSFIEVCTCCLTVPEAVEGNLVPLLHHILHGTRKTTKYSVTRMDKIREVQLNCALLAIILLSSAGCKIPGVY
jgi:hypothetical protein